MQMEITVLIDNEKTESVFRSEHGLSMLIEFKDKSFLFDTGKSDAFIQNAKNLNKDLSKIDYVILSHGHYDHTGGLKAFLELNTHAQIVMKKEAAFDDKHSMSTGVDRDISFPIKDKLELFKDRIVWVDDKLELIPEFHVLGKINRPADYTFTDSFLYVHRNGELIPDSFDDELFVVIQNRGKITVFTGCAHNGIENMLRTAVDYSGINEIEFVIGGTHLNRASEEQVDHTIKALQQFTIHKAAFNHCSGIKAVPKMKEKLNFPVEYGYGGTSYLF